MRTRASAVSALRSFLGELQGIAGSAGLVFAFVGGFFFVFSAALLVRHPHQAAKIAEVLQMSGGFLTAAWLLRFASGLWPFGRRFFR